MSQAGQVLHLYVEVRPVAEEEGKLLERGQLMLQCPDVLPCSQRSSARSSPTRSLDHSPVTQRHTGRGDQSLPRSESSSRHSVSFQLQEPDATGSPTHYHRQEVLCDGFSQLLQVISPGMMGSLGHTCSSDTEPYQGRVVISPSSTLSTTPTCDHKSCEVPEGSEKEKTSVVSFGYIEKSNVHNTDSRWELDKTFHRTEGQALPVHHWKRLSDPVWSRGQPERGDPYPNHSYATQTQTQTQTQTHSSRGWTHLQRAAQDAGARDAAHRAMEVFGSPELRQRFARHGQEIYSPTLPRHHQTPRCRSWGGSPILARSTLTLPSKAQPLEQGRTVCCGSMTGLPRTPAADHLCIHGGYSAHSVAPASKLCLRAPAQSQQRPRPVEESPRLSSKFHPPLPAGRPTDIQHQIPTGTFLSSNFSRTGCQTGGSCNHRVNSSCNATHSLQDRANDVSKVSIDRPYKSSRCRSRSGDPVSPTSGRYSVSPSLDAEVACKLAMEATKLSTVFAGRRTSSPTPSQAESRRSESPKTGGLSHPYPTLKGQQCPEPLQVEETNHKWRTDQTVPPNRQGSVSPLFHHTSLFSSTPPASPAAPHQAAASQSPAVDPRQEQSSSPSKDMSTLHHCPQPPQCTGHRKSPGVERRQYDDLSDGSSGKGPEHPRRIVSIQNPDVLSLSWTSRHQTGSVQHCKDFRQTSCRGNTPSQGDEEAEVVGVSVGQREEEVAAGTWSQSSSGVTGSIGDAPFPETSSQDTSCGSQLESSSTTRPSSRSQKIARAKWEFLFGAQREEGSCNTADTSPPTPLSPTPPSSHHRTPANQRRAQYREGQNLSHHRVQQVEVELVTPNVRGASPKTGIIRQTVKYSETDLDAVPLRCYRETDLDEVMRAEAEGAEEVEADSAFGSNRSILGNSSFSPSDVAAKGRMGGGKECDMEDGGGDEEEEVEEGVVSWASVRMLGDKQRQRATQEGDEVYSLLLKGSLAMSCDSHGGLKSPISVDSPRRPSDSNLDSFSRHFENIMESHRAKGTSYSSLDSVDLLTSGSTSVFTFDLPTLTPEIQSQICDSAKQIIELSFAPLAHPDPAAAAAATETSRSEISLSASGAGPQRGSTDGSESRSWTRSDKDSWHHSNLKDGFRKASSAPSLHSSPRERVANRPAELLDPQADVTRRLALDSSDEALANGTKADLQAARRLAKRLYHLDGFRKSDVARHLSKNNEFSQKVAEEYLSNFNFSGQNIDQALRLFLRQFALMGETQERERVLAHFSRRYSQCNPESLDTHDSVHTLTCAVMLLNSDLHGNNVGKRMSCSQFISNLEGLNNGKDFPKDLLKTLYSSIKNEKLQWTIDEEELRKSMSQLADVRTDAASHTMKRLGSGGNLLVGVAQQADGELYKSGFLVRKVHADPDGKRTPRGKRGWKSFYAMLKGLVLYLQKDEYRAERELTEEDVKNAVSIHHSLAMRAADYSKRPNVFYLRTADWRVFLFQAPNTEQMQSWITRINVVAAMFSAPPFPAAIGSQKRFSRPLLPGSNTKLSQEEQVKSHENRFRAVSSELAELTASTPDRKVKGRELEEQKLRQEYLEFEKTRYGTYAMLLRAKLSSADEDLAAFESRLFDNGGLQRAHSSPSLPQDASTKEKTRGTKKSKSLKVMSSSSSATRGSSSTGEGQKKNNGNNPQAELQEQSSDQEEALSV